MKVQLGRSVREKKDEKSFFKTTFSESFTRFPFRMLKRVNLLDKTQVENFALVK